MYKRFSKLVEEPSSYRPISFLDGARKLLERLLLNRIMEKIGNCLPSNQFGFRYGRGILKAVEKVFRIGAKVAKRVVQDRHLYVLVTLDARNAFNTAPWHLIDAALIAFGLYVRQLIRFYFRKRRILLPEDGLVHQKTITSGVP